VRRERPHQLLDLLGPRPLGRGSQFLQSGGERDVADRRAVGEARAAHQHVACGPGADAAQPREVALGHDGRAVGERVGIETAGCDCLRRADQVLGLRSREPPAPQLVDRNLGDALRARMRTHAVDVRAREIEQLAAQRARERHVDLLADDRPAQRVETARRERKPKPTSACGERGHARVARRTRLEPRDVEREAKQAQRDGVRRCDAALDDASVGM